MYVVTIVLVIIQLVLGCDIPALQPPIQDRVNFAKFVLQGKVLQHYPRGPKGLDTYIAEINVTCVFKASGPPVPGVVNVTNGGVLPGHCFQVELKKSREYVVFLRKLDNGYEASAKEVDVKDTASYTKLTSSCGLTGTSGKVTVNPEPKCPQIVSQPCPSTTPFVPTKRTKHPPHRRTHSTSTPATAKTTEFRSTTSPAKTTRPSVTKVEPDLKETLTVTQSKKTHSSLTKVTSVVATSTEQTHNSAPNTPLSLEVAALLAAITYIT